MQGTLTYIQREIRKFIGDVKDELVEGIDSMIDNLGGSDIAQTNRTGGLDTSDAADKLDWFMSKVVGSDDEPGTDSSRDVDNPIISGVMSQIPQDAINMLKGLLIKFSALMKEFVEDDLPVIIDAFLDGMAFFQAALQQPDRAKELVMSAILSIVKSMTVAGLSLIDIVITTVIEFVIQAMELFQKLINAKMDIPILSALYGKMTHGSDLTVLSLFSLILAVPATIISKIIIGRAPFANATAIAQAEESADVKQRKRGWAVSYGAAHAFMLVTDLVSDVQSGAQNQKVTSDKQNPKWTANKKHTYRGRSEGKKVKFSFIEKSPHPKTISVTEDAGNWIPAEGGSKMSKAMTAVQVFGILGGIFGQIAGNPVGHVGPGGLSQERLQEMRNKGADDPAFWSHSTWVIQWFYPSIGIVDLVSKALGAPSKVTDYLTPAATTALGAVHMGFMSKLVHEDRKTEDSTRYTRRRQAGWMFDTLPGLSKVLVYKELNNSTYNIPLVVHSVLFVTLGHLGEAIVYWARADSDHYDL